MSINIETVAEKTFNVLKGFGFEVRSFDKEGNLVINPKEATRFAVAEPNLLARLDIKEKALLLATSSDLSESPVRDMLKELAQDYLMSFDYKIFDKKIKPKGEKIDIKRNAETDMADVMEELNLLRRLSGLEENTKDPQPEGDDCLDCENGTADDGTSCKTCDGDGVDDGYFGGTKAYEDLEEAGIAAPYLSDFGNWSWRKNLSNNMDADDGFTAFVDAIILQRGTQGKGGYTAQNLSNKQGAHYKELVATWSRGLEINGWTIVNGRLQVDEGIEEADYSKMRPRPPRSEYMKVNPGRQEIVKQFGRAGEKLFDIAWGKTVEQLGSKASVKAAISATIIRAKELGIPDALGNRVDLSDVKSSDVMNRPDDDKIQPGMEPGGLGSGFESVNLSDVTLDMLTEASLGKMTGSRKSSYQPLADSVKIIVRHNKDVNEEIRGARSRNIHSILIQRGEEKFKMAENNLQAARAMARHLHNGGETFDTIGEAITEMSRDYGKLKEFVSYVRKAKLVNETNEEFVSLAIENINDIRTNLKRLSGVKSYANAVETVTNYNNVEMLQDDLDLESKFTETHFDDKVANVLDNLKVMASKRHAFESYITSAIAKETFENVKEQLKEDELMEFDTPHAKLGHQVSKLGFSAKDEKLGNYLHSISSKLNAGGQLNQFEYGAIKSSLLSAGQHNVQSQGAPMTATESYEAFLDQFIIL